MQLMLDVPEQYLTDKDPADLARTFKLYTALMMFQAGELSAGAAAKLADVDRFTFAEECMRHGIPLIDYPAEEFHAELELLRRIA